MSHQKNTSAPIVSDPPTSSSNPTSSDQVSSASSSSSASTRTSSTSSKGAPSNPVSTRGAVAIAVGAFLLGLLLGLLGFWFLMKLRKRSSPDRHERRRRTSSHFQSNRADKQMAVVTASEVKPDDTLLDPADNSALQTTMAQLNDFIDQHVENHYHEDPVNITESQVAKVISECGINTASGITVDDLARLLRAPVTRFAALRHFIAWVILSNAQLDAGQDVCLLPSYIVSLYKAFPPVERQAGCDEAFENALTKWKHLSAYLLVTNRSYREDIKLDEKSITRSIELNVKMIKHALSPFMVADPKDSSDYDKNLRAIIFRGAELGLLLWSQPSAWIVEWRDPIGLDGDAHGSGKARSKQPGRKLVVFPALLEKVQGRSNLRTVCDVVVA